MLCFCACCANNVRALNALPLNLPPGSEVYCDFAYINYIVEDDLKESNKIWLKVMLTHVFQALLMSRGISILSSILGIILKQFLVASLMSSRSAIHAVTYKGFLLKLEALIECIYP